MGDKVFWWFNWTDDGGLHWPHICISKEYEYISIGFVVIRLEIHYDSLRR